MLLLLLMLLLLPMLFMLLLLLLLLQSAPPLRPTDLLFATLLTLAPSPTTHTPQVQIPAEDGASTAPPPSADDQMDTAVRELAAAVGLLRLLLQSATALLTCSRYSVC